MSATPHVRPEGGGDPAWDDFGVYQVVDGVHRVPLALPDDGLRAVNVYVLDDASGPVLIDPGQAIGPAREQLCAALGLLGYRLETVQRSLVTHIHRDHYTQAVTLRREFGTRVGLGLGERESLLFVSTPGVHRLHAQLLILREAGAADLARLNDGTDDGLPGDLWEEPDDWFVPSSHVEVQARRLEVIETPGHTHGHIVFRDAAAGLLFAGDHVLPRITPSIGFEPVVPRLPLGDYLTSLQRVRAYADTMLLPAHGPITASVHTRTDELLEHHAERLAGSYSAVDADHRTARQIAAQLTWTRRHRPFDALHHGDQMLAVLETKAHLDVLVDRGRLKVGTDAGVTYYLRR